MLDEMGKNLPFIEFFINMLQHFLLPNPYFSLIPFFPITLSHQLIFSVLQ